MTTWNKMKGSLSTRTLVLTGFAILVALICLSYLIPHIVKVSTDYQPESSEAQLFAWLGHGHFPSAR